MRIQWPSLPFIAIVFATAAVLFQYGEVGMMGLSAFVLAYLTKGCRRGQRRDRSPSYPVGRS